MTARAGRKRRVPQPKRTARERLLEYVGGDGSVDYMGEDARKHTRTVRRLLRAHERELAERAVVEAAHQMERAYNSGISGRVFWYESPRDAVRAAALGRARRTR